MPTFHTRARHMLTSYRPLLLSFGFTAVLPLRSLALFSTTAGKATEAKCTRYLYRKPGPMATRESPWPVVFLRAKGLDVEEEGEWADWSGMFAERGYTSIEIDITAPPPQSLPSDESPFRQMTTALSSQAFIEDFPASGLVLVDPLPDEDPRSAGQGGKKGNGGGLADWAVGDKKGGWEWPKFRYEPHFPILLITSQTRMTALSTSNRLVRDHVGENPNRHGWLGGRSGKGVEVVVTDGLENGGLSEGARLEVEKWMDRSGF
ncbi:hypothetical protein CNBB5490 [Cryptococcus deneoformans B-3501A]|uniref:hypothetical protein n=1 Tax=Cryptococcus deneoformans (strain B-3501A) TaxID=283643 RepID=UPI000042FE35|nr:hypothetical protein CNBB5490 [Cryptococcus neoformans var. neoformans B-3501A]EAL22376.1 hypothetical protein CNBB5490 [Cryptococcus neoformans var. neoformans B-3501A]